MNEESGVRDCTNEIDNEIGYIEKCYSTDYSQQASCLLQTGQLSILLPQLAG